MPNPTWILVVVEDDAERSRAKLVAAIERRFPHLGVRGTGSGDEAMRWVVEPGCALLITVEESRRIDGLVLAACGRQNDPRLPVILLANPTAAGSSPTLERTGVERLIIPVSLARLVEHVERMIEPAPEFRGEVVVSSFLDLVRLLTAAYVIGALTVRHRHLSGTLWLEAGSVVHAALDGWEGIEAFHRMLRWRGGSFSFTPGAPPARSIAMPADQLVTECARFLDTERALARGSSPGLSATASQHFRKGLELLRKGKPEEALAELHQAAHLDLGNRSYREHLARVRELVASRSKI